MTIPQFEAAFPDEAACRAYLIARRWNGEVRCPRCGNAKVYALASGYHWQCYQCAVHGYRFSHLAGTIFENTNKPLRDWFRVTHMMLTSKKGVSALQIMRMMGFGSYKTAHYMCHRIRVALVEQDMDKLGGIVEVDETFVGGKDKNRHWDKKSGSTGGERSNKFIVIGAVERKGNAVARVIDRTDTATFDGFVRATVSDRVSLLSTDEHAEYRRLKATSLINSCGTALGSTWSARCIRIRLKASGRSSRAVLSAPFTRSASSVCCSMLSNFGSAIIIG